MRRVGPGGEPYASRARSYWELLKVRPEDAPLAGRTSSWHWLGGGVTVACALVLFAGPGVNVLVAAIVAVSAISWGLVGLLVIRWDRAPPLLLQWTTLIAYPVIVLLMATEGGSNSDAWVYLWLVGYIGFYFYERPVALTYLLLCVIVQVLPLIDDAGAHNKDYLSLSIIACGAYVVVGLSIIFGRERFNRLRELERVRAAQYRGLQRTATAAISGAGAGDVYRMAAQEAAELLGADGSLVLQATGDFELTIRSLWGSPSRPGAVGERVAIVPGGPFDRMRGRRETVVDLHPPGFGSAPGGGISAVLVAPVMVDGKVWGGLQIDAIDARIVQDQGALSTAETFADLLADIVTSLQERERLARDAMTDPLTGIANRSRLDGRLSADVSAAMRHARTLTVAMIDLDRLKEINDTYGHPAGDAAIRTVARCLQSVKRRSDTIGRFGGDEFMWIMPDTNSVQALGALGRLRRALALSAGSMRLSTTSSGVCDTTVTTDPGELLRCADTALYASKQAGGDRRTVYDGSMEAAGDAMRRLWRERARAIDGLRALARAIDAKDPATREHSERVSTFAGHLAVAADWAPDMVDRLREAALVHDVGKLGVPDAILAKSGPLEGAERRQMEDHVLLSAQIVGSVLNPEQVDWIRAHHERPDGTGYPSGLGGSDIPEGAALLALADAWDVMVMGRSYSEPKSVGEAYAECVRLRDTQFTGDAVSALTVLHDRGQLDGTAGD